MSLNSIARHKLYHIIVALIYFVSGIFIILKGRAEPPDQTITIIGSIITLYGAYRFWSGLRKNE
jgi:hypothetical protein